VFRREVLAQGFPDGTIAEDMMVTWDAMIAGRRAVYVGAAECYIIDPKTPRQLRTQLWRWYSGYFQCIRLRWRDLARTKKVLALIVATGVWDLISIPLWIITPFLLAAIGSAAFARIGLAAWLGTDLLVTLPVVNAGATAQSAQSGFWRVTWRRRTETSCPQYQDLHVLGNIAPREQR
jgi:cellulose synthase/poly-beta-1,6-N-acetylglucosamine synthase-like glycosyltransferase